MCARTIEAKVEADVVVKASSEVLAIFEGSIILQSLESASTICNSVNIKDLKFCIWTLFLNYFNIINFN